MANEPIKRKELVNFGKNRAIIIGIDSYRKIQNGNLTTPVADAEALCQVLTEFQGFETQDVTLLRNPTKVQIERLLQQLKEEGAANVASRALDPAPADVDSDEEPEIDLTKEGCLIFYYAGHGLGGDLDTEGPAGYIIPSDAKGKSASLADNTTLIPMEEIFKALDALHYHHTLLILDCCFAGTFRNVLNTRGEFGIGNRPLTRERFNRYTNRKAWQVLVSAGPTEKAADWLSDRGTGITAESGKVHSPFAKALIDALSPATNIDVKPRGKNLGDGVITSYELFLYLHDQVENLTRNDKKLKPQNPDLFPMGKHHDGGQFVFCDPRFPLNQLSWAKHKDDNPYKGLQQYDLGDSGYYFGREADVASLVEVMGLRKDPNADAFAIPKVLMITGPSGSGKSSLVKAGLLPHFLAAGYELFQLRPGTKPWKLAKYQNGTTENDSWQHLSEEGSFSLLTHLDPTKQQLLYIDQYEELFTECTDHERAQLEGNLERLFIEILQAEARQGKPEQPLPFRLILSIRSDFEWQLELSSFGRLYWQAKPYYQLYRLSNPGLDDLRSALVNPAYLLAYEFEEKAGDNLIDLILQDLNYQNGALPLLSYTMQEFVKANKLKRSDKRTFTFETYQNKLGGISGVLSKRMDEIYQSYATASTGDSPQQSMFRNIFLRMVRLNDGEYSRRRLYRTNDLDELDFRRPEEVYRFVADPEQETLAHRTATLLKEEILNRLFAEELLTFGGDEKGRQPYVELVHDALINTWTTGKQWINELGKDQLLLQGQLWQAVVERQRIEEAQLNQTFRDTVRQESAEHIERENRFVAKITPLWDNNPKLFQVIEALMSLQTHTLLVSQETPLNRALDEISAGLPPKDQTLFEDLRRVWLVKGASPNLDSLIITGASLPLLQAIIREGVHWLNRAEAEFLLESWKKRTQSILQLKKERDEARANELANKVALSTNRKVAFQLAAFANAIDPGNLRAREELIRSYYLSDQPVYYTLIGHVGIILSFALHPNGQILASCGDRIRLWDLQGGISLAVLDAHHHQINQLAFHPTDGSKFASASTDGTVIIWHQEADIWQPAHILSDHQAGVNAVCFSDNGLYLASGDDRGRIIIWSSRQVASTNTPPTVLFKGQVSDHDITTLGFSPENRWLVMGNRHGEVKILPWDAQQGTVGTAIPFDQHSKSMRIYYSRFLQGAYGVSGGWDRELYRWKIQNGGIIEDKLLAGPNDRLDFFIHDCAFSPKLDRLALLVEKVFVYEFNWATGTKGKLLYELTVDLPEKPDKVIFSGDGKKLIVSTMQYIQVWQLKFQQEPPLTTPDRYYLTDGHDISTEKLLVISASGTYRLESVRDQTVVHLFKNTHERVGSFDHQAELRFLRFMKDERSFLTAGTDGKIKFWEIGKTEPVHELITYTDTPKTVAHVELSEDEQLLIPSLSSDQYLYIWLLSGDKPYDYRREEGLVTGLVSHSVVKISPDQINMLVLGQEGLKVYQPKATGEIDPMAILHIKQPGMWYVHYSANGKLIYTYDFNTNIKVWDAQSGVLKMSFPELKQYPWGILLQDDKQWLITSRYEEGNKLFWLDPAELINEANATRALGALTPGEIRTYNLEAYFEMAGFVDASGVPVGLLQLQNEDILLNFALYFAEKTWESERTEQRRQYHAQGIALYEAAKAIGVLYGAETYDPLIDHLNRLVGI